jgi:hypothetical protein
MKITQYKKNCAYENDAAQDTMVHMKIVQSKNESAHESAC